jgi:hypothetical protein
MIDIIENEYELLSVGEIVKKIPRAASVFSELKIEHYCFIILQFLFPFIFYHNKNYFRRNSVKIFQIKVLKN